MKTLYLDCFSGISGDMFLGLVLDLGLEKNQLESELAKLNLPGWQLHQSREQRHGIEGCRVTIECTQQSAHRHWQQIDQLLAESLLAAPIRLRARRIFKRLGEAEAKVHGIALEQVHFHEVGALDAIIDLVGAAIGLELLGIEQLICSPLPLSRGLSRCAHGALPLPAPAVLELLTGHPVLDSAISRELVTPSGAAIACESTRFGAIPSLLVEKTAYGVGGWQLEDRPNLLRGILGTSTQDLMRDQVTVLETNIDDSNPEWLGALFEDLLTAGALDVTCSPLQMKKNRPATCLSVVCHTTQREELAHLILTASTAGGVRSYPVERFKLTRRLLQVETSLGPAQAKLFFDGDRLIRVAPEYAHCRALAQKNGQPLPEIYRLVEAAARRQFLQEEGAS
jgi:uncharacterized protein (TIGR00299 family) protein